MKSTKRKAVARPTLRDLLIEQNALEDRLIAALEREYPIGTEVCWAVGDHEQRGRVIDHTQIGARLLAENVRTGKQKWLSAAAVHQGDAGEWL